MISFEATDSVFNINIEGNSFSISIPGRWRLLNYLEDIVIDKLKKLLNLRSQNVFELHVDEVRKRGDKKIADGEYKLSDLDTSKNEILEELKNDNYLDLEDLVQRMQLAYDEFIDILDVKYILSERTGYTLPHRI